MSAHDALRWYRRSAAAPCARQLDHADVIATVDVVELLGSRAIDTMSAGEVELKTMVGAGLRMSTRTNP